MIHLEGREASKAEPNYLNHKDIDWSMINTQADGDLTTALCSLPKIQSEDGQDYVQLADVLETVRRYVPSVSQPQDGDRAISLNAVIEAIDVWDSYAKTIERIKELPSVKPQEPKWIPVSERLPETDDEVLITADNGGIYIGFIYKYGSKEWYMVGEYHEPIAWMPLPTPYEPQERSE